MCLSTINGKGIKRTKGNPVYLNQLLTRASPFFPLLPFVLFIPFPLMVERHITYCWEKPFPWVFSSTVNRAKNELEIDRSTKAPRGLHQTISFIPPQSPYSLVQENLYDKPWQLLIATIFLNKTTGSAALPIFWKFIEKYENPESVLTANPIEIAGKLS